MPSSIRRFAVVYVLAAATALATTTPAAAVTPPRKDIFAAIEAPAPYQGQFLCRTSLQPGVAAFRTLVLATYSGTSSASEVRSCSGSGTSEHKDGRGWDWGVDVAKKKQKAQASALLAWLLAPDGFGNDFAMARRLGIMYIIWDKRVWRAYNGGWGPYSCSGVTACHQDHMHFSFGWAGAYKKTSYWTKKVAPVMAPPIPVFDSLTATYTVKVSARKARVWGSQALRLGRTYSYRASGIWNHGAKATQVADAACIRRSDGTWRRATHFRASGVWTWWPTTDTGGGCNTKDHTYVATALPRLTDAINFSMTNTSLGDNSGSITVRIRRVL